MIPLSVLQEQRWEAQWETLLFRGQRWLQEASDIGENSLVLCIVMQIWVLHKVDPPLTDSGFEDQTFVSKYAPGLRKRHLSRANR